MLNPKLKRGAIIICLPLAFFCFIYGLFGLDGWQSLYSVMGISFLFLVPVAVGALTIYLSPVEKARKFAYMFFVPWIPVLLFFGATILFNLEGWACWIMILPVFLIASSIGGMIGAYFKTRKKNNEKLYVSVFLFLPFFISPIEQSLAKIPGQYEADTYIDIHASKEKIWSNVTRVREISKAEDKGWLTRFMGFPRPIKAELNYEGVGAYRKAIFDKGLVFNEVVLSYEHQKKMVFSIKANPYDIPSTTMDQHIVVGGKFFDVLNGTYELDQINDSTCRLNLYSHFKLTTTFNFYASWWAGLIMKDIQSNILQVIKKRAESESY
jgi:hypothetical protein